jgi:hypothetical protein
MGSRLLSHSLNQDLADSNTSTDFTKASLHGLHTTTHSSIEPVNTDPSKEDIIDTNLSGP